MVITAIPQKAKNPQNNGDSILTPGSFQTASIAEPNSSTKNSCNRWDLSETSANIKWSEVSGLASSSLKPDYLYHIEDSGNEPRVYITDKSSNEISSVWIPSVSNRDWEAMTSGPCRLSNNCVFVGEIGDNSRQHDTYKIIQIEEESMYGSRVNTFITEFRYSTGKKYDAESIAYNPRSQSIFIFTKGDKSLVFELTKEDLQKTYATAKFKWELPIYKATGASISKDGSKFVVLNYYDFFEYDYDITKISAPSNYTRKVSKSGRSPQQEAIVYDKSDDNIIYVSSEQNSPLRTYQCN